MNSKTIRRLIYAGIYGYIIFMIAVVVIAMAGYVIPFGDFIVLGGGSVAIILLWVMHLTYGADK